MSNTGVFAFVEGDRDISFYDGLCSSYFKATGASFGMRRARDLPGATGGKVPLMHFARFCEKKNVFSSSLDGKVTKILIFVDKDIDDLKHSMMNHNNVIYTEYYCLENYLFKFGDLTEAVSTACALSRQEVEMLFPDWTLWRKEAALQLKDWIALWIFSGTHSVNDQCNYGQYSTINGLPGRRVDKVLHRSHYARIAAAAGLTEVGSKRVLNRLFKNLDAMVAAGEYDKILKGDWYAVTLELDLREIAPRVVKNWFRDVLLGVLNATVNFGSGWTNYYMARLRTATG